MDEIIEKMVQHGFSVAVASFLLVRMDRRVEELTRAVVQLINILEAKEALKN